MESLLGRKSHVMAALLWGPGDSRLLLVGGLFVTLIVLMLLLLRLHAWWIQRQPRWTAAGKAAAAPNTTIVAFFHPYCAGGGGGERVLWKAMEVLGDLAGSTHEGSATPLLEVVIYTIDSPTLHYQQDLLQHVQDRFSIALSDKLKLSFVHLHEHVALLQAAPFLSMVLESWGSLRLAWRGLARSHARGRVPHVWIDTTGCAFTYLPAVLLYGCTVVAYVHYPTISTDMLRLVWERPRRASYNHAAEISNSRWKTAVKVIYYSAFALAYGAVGSLATCVMVNSTWTYHHIRFLWKGAAWRGALSIVYPPCNVADLQALARPQTTTTPRQPVILSIGQFRPEKDHSLQLQAVAKLFQDHPSLQTAQPPVKLVMVGGCRNAADDARLAHLKELATTLGIADRVTFCVNQPYPVVRNWLSQAKVGLHTMWNEHFGIGIVEMMAAGLLTVAHNSGGPATDLIVPGQTGFLAATVDEYATALFQALTMKPEESQRMQEAACQSSARFSDQVFRESFRKALVDSKVL